MPADGFDAAAKNRDLGTSRWQLLKGQWEEHTSVARMSEEAWRSQCPAIRPLSGDKRKWLRHRQADVIDPNRTFLAATDVDSSCAARPNFHDDRQRPRHLHSMTRSARFSISAGTVTPSSRAVLRLITSWCFEKTSIAVSAGFAPLRILSTYTGTRGYVDV